MADYWDEATRDDSGSFAWAIIVPLVCAGILGYIFDSITVGVIVFCIGIVITISRRSKKSELVAEDRPVEILYRAKSTDEPEYLTYIAGVTFRNDRHDIGGFIGWVSSDPNNSHDPNAIAIYRSGGKLVGYIPKKETKSFREWSNKECLPCIGYINKGDEVDLYGKVKVLDTTEEGVRLEMAKFVAWMISNFGVSFVPDGFTINTPKPPRTEAEWLDTLYEMIDESER